MADAAGQLTILMVDDEVVICKLVEAYFRKQGCRVVCAGDGTEGLAQMQQCSPDIVLLDVRLPGMNGCVVCRRMRELSNVPIIMLSAHAQFSDREQGLAAGANAYITKPFSLKELDRSIRELVCGSPATCRRA